MFGNNKEKLELEKLEVEAKISLDQMDKEISAKEEASKFLGKYAIIFITAMFGSIIYASTFLDASGMTAIVGLGSAVIMALISMLMGITGTKDKESNPLENALVESQKQNGELMAALLSKDDSMEVEVNDGVVNISKGKNTTKVSK